MAQAIGAPLGPAAGQGGPGGPSGDDLIKEISGFVGKVPYVWGGASPAGMDCSGMIYYGLTKLGVKNVPRTSEAQWAWVHKLSADQVQPGDLVFFTGDLSAGDASPGHVGVVTRTGSGGAQWQMIDAPQSGMDVSRQTFSVPGSGVMHIVGFGRPPGVSPGTAPGTLGTPHGFSLSLPSQVTGFFDQAETFVQGAMWFLNPENWMRVLAGVFGGLLLIGGLLVFAKAAS